MLRFVALIAFLTALLASPVAAQDTSAQDRSFLTAFLEDNLSGAGRTVRIEGFAGALSSRATFSRLSIADDAGVWLTITDGALSWNRSALLSGRVQISEMSAKEIVIDRRPTVAGSGGGWSAGTGFSLPELPVSVQIDTISAATLALGAAVLGEPVTMSINGSVSLSGGEGQAALDVVRTDGQKGEIAMKAGFSNATQVATLDLLMREDANGLAANLLGIPGRPPLELAVNGTGPISDLKLDIGLTAAKVNRVAGTVTLQSVSDPQSSVPARQFSLDVSGNVAPLFLPAYQAFFGDSVKLSASGTRAPDGQIALERVALSSSALSVSGSISLTPDYLPVRAKLTAQIGLDGLKDVVLPIPGPPTSVRDAILNVTFDKDVGPDWSVSGRVGKLSRPGLAVTTTLLDGAGRFFTSPGPDARDTLDGKVSFVAGGISVTDPALSRAIGPFLNGKAVLHWQEGAPFAVSDIAVVGQGYAGRGDVTFSGLDSDLAIDGKLIGNFRDLSQLSGLADRQIGGSGIVTVDGRYAPLSGAFDAIANIAGKNVSVGIVPLDRLLVGESRIDVSAARDTMGLTLRSLNMTSRGIVAKASGRINADLADVTAEADLTDLSLVGNGVRGRVYMTAKVGGRPDDLTVAAEGTAQGLAVGNASADRLIGGTSTVKLSGGVSADGIMIKQIDLANPSLSLRVVGQGSGLMQPLQVNGRLNDIGLLTPSFSGPLTVLGSVVPSSAGYAVDLAVEGPGKTRARLDGKTDTFFSKVEVRAAGSVESAIANPFISPASVGGTANFDLRMSGPVSFSSVSGNVALPGAQISVPVYGISVTGVTASAQIAGGVARISGSGGIVDGGTVAVDGSVGLSGARDADLKVGLSSAHLRNPQFFDTSVSGNLTVVGPMAGSPLVSGQLVLGETEIRLAASSLGGASFFGQVHHEGDATSVRETRVRAGLEGKAAGGGAGAAPRMPIRLDVAVSAPRRIFVRGRGLDAELGGQVRLQGTSSDVRPSGDFNLVRGRLDLLGKRFDITEGVVRLQGALIPTLRFVATTSTDNSTTSIVISGPATAPAITFESQPPLPEEEVVSRLLFARSLVTLSPFQAAQLASAVATLTGRGGDGLVSRLRKSFGLDDFDLATAADGTVALRAGKYLSDRVYSDVSIDQNGQSVVRLNLDISKSVTARGHVASDGTTGIGIYYDRDY